MAVTRPGPEQRTAPRLRPLALLVVGLSLLALVGAWTWGRLHPGRMGAPEQAVAGGRADAIMRRTEVAFADAVGVWQRLAADGSGQRYATAELTFFSRATVTPCAGGAMVSGPFYCADTGTAAFDLAFLDALSRRLQRQEDLGIALVAARVSAEHLQRELGVLDAAALRLIGAGRGRRALVGEALALQADCLTGVWAAAAGKRLGPVPAGFWSQLVWSSRNVAEELASQGPHAAAELNPFARAAREARQDAFQRGYAGDGIAACPPPAEIVARG